MPTLEIDSLDDPRIAPFRQLKATNLTRAGNHFVVEGEKLLDRLIESRYPLASVLATDRFAARLEARLPAEVPLYVAPEAMVSMVVGFQFHRGVLGLGCRLPAPDLSAIVERAGPRLTLVVCPSLRNPENLGTIARTADVFGVDALLVGPSCPDPLSRRVLRVSMGSVLRLPVRISADLGRDLDVLRRESQAELVATVTDPSAEPLGTFQRPARLALLLGSEGFGLEADWIARCDRRITIPMRAGAESLNVAVASGIVLYHVLSESR